MPSYLLPLILSNLVWILIIGSLIVILLYQRRRYKNNINNRDKTLQASRRIYQIILEDLDFQTVIQKIADTIPSELRFGTGVVAIFDEEKGLLHRVGASRTKEAQEAIKALSVPFDKIEISITDPNNLMARALRDQKSYITSDVFDVLGPVLSREESQKIQTIMGTKTTLIYPIYLKEKPLGVFLASTRKTQAQLTDYELYIINDFVNLVGLVLQNSKLYTSLKSANSSLRSMTNEVYRMNQQLHQLDKLKDDFVSIASHELRTPMTAIRSYSWMALYKSDIPLSPKLKRYLERTLLSTERLINLVNEMLNISRIESGKIEVNPEAFDIQSLIGEIISEVEPKAHEKRLRLQVFEINLPKVFADSDKVHQVLLNLIGNAMKFTPNQGLITISFFSDGTMVEVRVKDSGVGIAKEDLPRLFKKFGRLDNSYVAAATSGGTGLGLFISKSLIELMGGKIWVESDGLGHGATFKFSLPAATRQVIDNSARYSRRVGEGARSLEPVAL